MRNYKYSKIKNMLCASLLFSISISHAGITSSILKGTGLFFGSLIGSTFSSAITTITGQIVSTPERKIIATATLIFFIGLYVEKRNQKEITEA